MKLNFKSKEELLAFIAENIINTAEATEILNCTRQNIYYLIKQGKLKPVKDLTGDRLFFKEDILARKKDKD